MKNIVFKIISFPYSLWAVLLFIVVTALVIFPLALIFTLTLGKRAIYYVVPLYRYWAKVYNFLIFVKIKCYGLEDVDKKKAYIFVGNHGSFMDIMAFGSTLKNTYKVVAKRELLNMPILGLVFKMAAIMVDRSSEESRKRTKDDMRKNIEDGVGVLVFAEGTRNRTDALLTAFKDGAFRIAFDSGVDIVPFCIVGAKKVIAPNSFWMKPGTISIYYLPVVKTAAFSTYEDLKQHVYNLMLNTLVEKSGN